MFTVFGIGAAVAVASCVMMASYVWKNRFPAQERTYTTAQPTSSVVEKVQITPNKQQPAKSKEVGTDVAGPVGTAKYVERLRNAAPGADDSFILELAEEEVSVAEAMRRYIQHLEGKKKGKSADSPKLEDS
jgi:hypothetical protein